MFKKLLYTLINLMAWPLSGILLFFTARRWFFIFFALTPRQTGVEPVGYDRDLSSVLLLVPVRNEANTLPDLLPALDRLDYPVAQLTLVFINDGSTDTSEAILQSWTATRPNWHVLSLQQNRGKANALNRALSQFPQGEIIAIFDADERPLPATLKYLTRHFSDPQVAAVSGRRAVANPVASLAASYTTFESLVHQMITMRAKDRLQLAPALLGSNCAYRRSMLAEVGNFKPGALLEDSDLTLKLTGAGWRTRFEPEAISYHYVPESVGGYWKQHTRWARGFADVAQDQTRTLLARKDLPRLLRLELLIFSVGYLDRLALLAVGGLALLGSRIARWSVAVTLLTPLVQVLAALSLTRAPLALWRRVIWLPVFLGLDMAMAANGFWGKLLSLPQIWEDRRTRR
ncbi:MAG: glycosyltransferase [Anaerolineae bacterium]|nr:glycosyltransferase [Anaerolineae bacterium]